MVDANTFAAFVLASFILVVVPGPSVLFVISRGVALGRKAAVLTVAGNTAGVVLQAALVAAGIGSLVERSVTAYEVIRLAGAAYIVYLGVQAVRHRRELSMTADAAGVVRSPWRLVREGFVVGITNPKAIVFFTAVLPQFVDPHGAPVPLQMLLLGAVSGLVALVSDSAWGILAGSARSWLAGAPHRLERMSATGGLVMVALGARLAITGRRD